MKYIILGWLLFGCYQMSTRQSTYTNPLDPNLNISDPFVLQNEGGYYLYATTDANEGFRAWRSDDLVNWEAIGWYPIGDRPYRYSAAHAFRGGINRRDKRISPGLNLFFPSFLPENS